jgi:hypothetical protein
MQIAFVDRFHGCALILVCSIRVEVRSPAGVERSAISRRTLQGGLLRLFALVSITAPGMPRR